MFSLFPSIDNPRISPGGRAIAAKVRLQGKQALAVLPIGTNQKPEIIAKDGEFDSQGERLIRSYAWIDDDNLLITLTSRENFMGQWFDAGRVVNYNRSSRKTTPLGWAGSKFDASDILWISREGPPSILLSRVPDNGDTERWANPEVIKIDVVTGEQKIVQRQNPIVNAWYADGKGNVRLGAGYDRESGKFTAIYRPDGASTFKTIIDEKQDRFDTPSVPRIFLKEPNKALTISRKDGYRAVYALDLNTMKLGEKVFGVPGYDIDGISSDLEGDDLESVMLTKQRSEHVYFQPRLKQIQMALQETFTPGVVTIASADRARETIIAHVGGVDHPGAYYVYDTRSGDMRLLGWLNNAIKDAPLNPTSTIKYQASDGKAIEAVLTIPRHKQGQKGLPLIVLPHGGPWARDSEDWEYVPWRQPLAELGYVVIQPNFRGSDGYGKEWESASDGNWGERMQDDLNDAVAHLASQGLIDPKRVCVMGWSYGGYAASRAAQRDGEKFRCAISGAGVHDLPAMVAYDRDYLGDYGAKNALGAAGKLTAVSPGLHPKQYSAPILIVHGEKDRRVPVLQSRNLVKRLKNAGKVEGRDFVYVEIPRETHNLLLESSRLQVLKEVKAFLDKHNPA